MSKIDIHVHVTPPEIINNLEKYTAREPYLALISSSPKNKFAAAEEVVLELESAGFDRAVVFGFSFKDGGLCRFVNDYVIEKVKEFPQKLTGFIAMPPGVKEAEKEIARCYDAGLRGIGELFPTGQGIKIEDKKETSAWTAAALERNIPVLVHANEPVGHYYPGKTNTTLRQLEQFVENNPTLKIILAHWGGGIFLFEMMKELKEKFANVYYDCAASPLLYESRVYKTACLLGLQQKILFGSDYPLLPIARYLSEIDKSGISEEEKKLLLGSNAAQLLNV
ncbi:4-hydroxyphenyl-beta-ketoacyl-CoA hydrolase [Spirochaetia bacterium]|nr:4-hydroxyphenyl-beta-ketoacyl-CoA hydrolase [Spirochaetia bacterium]